MVDPTYAIFDTFAGTEGRDAHLTGETIPENVVVFVCSCSLWDWGLFELGKVAEALLANAPNLLSSGPDIKKVNILASKVSPCAFSYKPLTTEN